MAFESGKRTTVAKPISPADTTIYLASVPTVTSGRLYLKNDAQEERISFSGVSGSTVTGCNRNLSKVNDPVTSSTGLTWVAGTVVKLVLMHDQIVDKAGSNTWAGNQTITGNLTVSGTTTTADLRFTGTTTSGLRIKTLTTAQRDALTPATGDKIINSTTGTEQTYYGGTWNDAGTSTTPNASTTVAGKVEKATSGEVTAGTSTGGTGAELFVGPAELKTVTDGLTTSINAKPSIASNSTASTGTNTTDAINALQLKKYFGPEPSAGTTYTAASATGTLGSTSGTTYLQARIGTIARTGTYTVEFSVSSGAGVTGYGRIYKNGVAFGTERTVVGTTTAFSENLAFAEGDTISLWYKSGGGGSASVLDLAIKYNLVDQKAFTLA